MIGRKYIFDFGRYKDESLLYVLKYDPQYLEWCDVKIDWFQLDDFIRLEVDETLQEEYRRRMENDI